MADFVAQINYVNSVADTDPGFVGRLRAEGADDATNIRAFDDDRILITPTVWKSLEALSGYVCRGAPAGVMHDRRRWFEKAEHPILALWWVPVKVSMSPKGVHLSNSVAEGLAALLASGITLSNPEV